METQNITLSMPKDVLLKVKLIAVKGQTSASDLLTQMLENLVQQEDAYARAHQRHLPSWAVRRSGQKISVQVYNPVAVLNSF